MTSPTLLVLLSVLGINNLLANASPTHTSSPTRRAMAGKTGLSWTDTSIDVSQFTSSGKINWFYNWGPNPPASGVSGLEFVPMFWGNKSIDAFQKNVPGLVSSGSVAHILGFNEPQQQGQSELSPQEGAELWKTYIQPLKSGPNGSNLRLGSPAPANGPSAKEWLGNFTATCPECTLDFIALHWYYINATQFISYLTDMHDTFQKPIWVTEWSCQNFAKSTPQCSQDEIASFMNATQSFMDNTDWVERYAWFGAFKSMPDNMNPDLALLNKDGKITSLGQQYIGGASSASGSGSGSGSGPNISAAAPSIPSSWTVLPLASMIASVIIRSLLA